MDLLPADLDPENKTTVQEDASEVDDEVEPITADVNKEITDEDA